jgi:hypothetical protein
LAHLDAAACTAGTLGCAGGLRAHRDHQFAVLYDLLGAVHDWLGFDAGADPVFRDLAIARIVEPTSKLDSLYKPAVTCIVAIRPALEGAQDGA